MCQQTPMNYELCMLLKDNISQKGWGILLKTCKLNLKWHNMFELFNLFYNFKILFVKVFDMICL